MDPEGSFPLSTGARIPAIGFGTWLAAENGEVKRAVKFALECGYRSIDCAHLYGTEKDVGEALSEAMAAGLPRDKLFVTSKLWCTTSTAKRVTQVRMTEMASASPRPLSTARKLFDPWLIRLTRAAQCVRNFLPARFLCIAGHGRCD